MLVLLGLRRKVLHIISRELRLEMGSNEEMELIQTAIQRLIQDKQQQRLSDIAHEDEDDDQFLLSTLLSQLESLKGDGTVLHRHRLPVEEIEAISPDLDAMKKEESECKSIDDKKDDGIVKELKKLKKQNTITHGLLSVMILLTLAWQLSEVSLIWKVKNHFGHPFRSIGDMFSRVFKPPVNMNIVGQDKTNGVLADKKSQIEVPGIPPLKIPELPNMDLSSLALNGNEDCN